MLPKPRDMEMKNAIIIEYNIKNKDRDSLHTNKHK